MMKIVSILNFCFQFSDSDKSSQQLQLENWVAATVKNLLICGNGMGMKFWSLTTTSDSISL